MVLTDGLYENPEATDKSNVDASQNLPRAQHSPLQKLPQMAASPADP